jgi:hypothetical protein
MRKIKSLFLVFFLALTFVLPSMKVSAAENYITDSIIKKTVVQTDDTNLSRKESVIEFMNKHPEYKDEVMKILSDKGALNSDGSVKNDLGISNNNMLSQSQFVTTDSYSPIYTGYEYEFAGSGPADFYPKEIVAKYTNNTSKDKQFSVVQTYTVSTSTYSENSIGAKVSLDKIYEINAGVKSSYTYTQSAATQYGTNVSVPAYTTGVLEASAIKQCYSFFEQYYVLGVAVGNRNTIGVFKPTGIHWYYSEEKN